MICSASTGLPLGIEVNRGHIPSCTDVLVSSSLLLRCKSSQTRNAIVSHSRKLKDIKLAQVVEYERILGHYMTVLLTPCPRSRPNQDRWSEGHHSGTRVNPCWILPRIRSSRRSRVPRHRHTTLRLSRRFPLDGLELPQFLVASCTRCLRRFHSVAPPTTCAGTSPLLHRADAYYRTIFPSFPFYMFLLSSMPFV